MNFLCWFIDEWRMIWDISNIHKSHPPRHCFNISKHSSISVLFFHNFCIMFCVFFCWIFWKYLPRGRGFSRNFLPQTSGCCTVFVPTEWEFVLSKNSPGICSGGWSGLELTDTLITIDLLLKYVLALYAGFKILQSSQNKHQHVHIKVSPKILIVQ